MKNQNALVNGKLHALLLADHIYRDEGTGKYVIAGTFHQLNVEACPTTFGKTIGIFVSLSGFIGEIKIEIEFLDTSSEELLMCTQSLQILCEDPHLPVEFAVEVPPLPLPHVGRYFFRITANGSVLGTFPLNVIAQQQEG